MKKNTIFAMLLSLACSAGFISCSDEDTLKQPLPAPSVSNEAGNYQSLSFNWEKVENTIQYGYKLYDPEEAVVEAGVTTKTSASFSGLKPATTYTLRVWAFNGMDSDYSSSPAAEITATTAALIKLATPTLTISNENGKTVASWNAVADAETYEYSIRDAANLLVTSGSIAETSYTIKGLDEGDYTFNVTATTTQGGYLASDMASATFHVDKAESWRVTGTYYSESLNQSWEATIVAYSNGSYSILSFYGVEGYNFDFTPAADGSITIDNGAQGGDSSFQYWIVPTGLSSQPEFYPYPWGGNSYCGFEGGKTGGNLWLGNYYGSNFEGWGEDTFTWSGVSVEITSVDDLVGTYTNHAWGFTYLGDDPDNGEDYEAYNWTATVEKIDDTTVSIDGLYWLDCPVIGKVDFSAGTITFDPQEYATYYTFSGVDGYEYPVVATFEQDGTIIIPEYCLWSEYAGVWYWYLYGQNELTKSTAATSKAAPAAMTAKSVKSTRTSTVAQTGKIIKPSRPGKSLGKRLK